MYRRKDLCILAMNEVGKYDINAKVKYAENFLLTQHSSFLRLRSLFPYIPYP